MKYYDVFFDKDYAKKENCLPKGKIEYKPIDDDTAVEIVKKHILGVTEQCFKEPDGVLKYKYLVPGGGYTTLWDWDSFFMSCAIDDEKIEYAKGCICNLIENIGEDGKPAKNVSVNGETYPGSTPLPLQAQFGYVVAKRLNDFSWLEKYWDNLEKMIVWFDANCMREGMYVYRNIYGNGIDNNPAVYGRADMSTSACDFITFMYRELRAMEKLSRMFEKGREDYYAEKADKLKTLFQTKYFDYMDKCFYNIDCNVNYKDITLQGVNWVTFLKFRNWSILFPLWGKLATKEQAECVKNMIMSEDEFLSVCGIRSHSKADPVYNNVPMGNPSNWQGPVWGLTTFLTAYGLARCGYKDEAYNAAMRLVKTYAMDITQNGCIHEYYHGDSGQPLIRPDFLSWNLLALRVIDDIKSGVDHTTFDLLD